MIFPSNLDVCDCREVQKGICPQCNTVVHAMECNRSMRLRKVCVQCNTVVHVKRSVTVAMPSHQRKGKHGEVNTQVQSHPLLRRRFGTSVPFHYFGTDVNIIMGKNKCDHTMLSIADLS